MKTKRSMAVVSMVVLLGMLTGCGNSAQKAENAAGKNGAKNDATKSDATKSDTTSQAQAAAGDAAAGAKTEDGAAKGDQSKTADAGSGKLPGQIRISLNEMPDDMVICTVYGHNITIGDYRRMQKLQQAQLQTQISQDPMVRAGLDAQAKQRHIKLTPEERTKLIETAKAQHKDFAAFLKGKNMTEAQFDEEVEEAGVEFKMANLALEESLLPQLVSREILANAASKAGREKAAQSAVNKAADTQDFQNLKAQTGLSQGTLKSELVKGELAKYQIQQIAKGVRVSDREVRDWYNKNKGELKHPERIRLSSILVICPETDIGPIQSVRTQVKKANPKLEGKDLDAAVANVEMAQQNKALIALGEAEASGSNFAKLANDKTEDPLAHQKKNGGDMGWQDKGQLVPQFADAVWSLKSGTVLPKLVKTAEGYRIIKVTGHEQSGPRPLEEVRPIIEAKLKQDKLNQAVQAWVNQQQRTANIQFSQRFLAAASSDKNKTH